MYKTADQLSAMLIFQLNTNLFGLFFIINVLSY